MVTTTRPDSLVKKIFATDKRIQFCGVVDANGNLEAGGMRPGVQYLEPAAETAKIVTRMFLNQAIVQANDRHLGRVSWVMVRREKLLQITFPLPERKQLQIATRLDYPISKVTKLVKYANQLGNIE